jgi:hypothetical protein
MDFIYPLTQHEQEQIFQTRSFALENHSSRLLRPVCTESEPIPGKSTEQEVMQERKRTSWWVLVIGDASNREKQPKIVRKFFFWGDFSFIYFVRII